jgi:diketogulonate reductase-like aldo/keto reductase
LIHSPYGGKIVETWHALVKLQEDGFIRNAGVSNFGVKHLKALKEHSSVLPAVNQIEMHPLIYEERKVLLNYCKEGGIAITAYGSIFFGNMDKIGHASIKTIADAHGKTSAQVLLRWGLEHGFAIIPKSVSSKARQQENRDIFDFELTTTEMKQLDQLQSQTGAKGTTAYWNPVEEADVDLGDITPGTKREL